MKIAICMDSFKGSVDSKTLAKQIKSSIENYDNTIETLTFSLSDGGEGLLDAFSEFQNLRIVKVSSFDPLLRPKKVSYGIHENKTAVIETAETVGLNLLNKKERNPMLTTSYGIGVIILDALNRGIRDFIIGIGGSATNDCGMGLLEALGARFYDYQDTPLSPIGKSLNLIRRIDITNLDHRIKNSNFQIVCDVLNPLFGDLGAAKIFCKQKGANQEEILYLDQGLMNFHDVTTQIIPNNYQLLQGSGAAGGLGYSLRVYLNASLRQGIDIILESMNFEERVKNVDLIITGEGKIDDQSFMGKVLSGVLFVASKYNIYVIALGGSVDYQAISNTNIDNLSIFSILNEPVSLTKAMNKTYTLKMIDYKIKELLKLFINAKKER
jgi:glycerate kinase